MAKWKLFGRSRSKEEIKPEHETTIEISQDSEESTETKYHETLYSKGHTPKKGKMSTKTYEKPWRQRNWENVSTIEKNIDDINKRKIETKTDVQAKPSKVSDIEKKVDRVLSKKKK